MNGDIISSTVPRPATVPPTGYVPRSSAGATGGYGLASFGQAPTAAAATLAHTPTLLAPASAPTAPAATIAPASRMAPAATAAPTTPLRAESPAEVLLPANASHSKAPLILTIVGIVIVVGGIAGLFMYALHS